MESRDWRYWLRETSDYYKITQKDVLSRTYRKNKRAKSTFYWLLFKAGLDLYKVSESIKKNRSAIPKYINDNTVKGNKNRDRIAEDFIINKSK